MAKPFEKAVAILEYDKILTVLASLCAVEAGKEKIMTLRPEGDLGRVVRLQKETAAAKRKSTVSCRGDEIGSGYSVRYRSPKVTVFG